MVSRKELELGGRKLIIETGKVAKQASGAVTVQYGETMILATAVASDKPVEQLDFMPLQVEYRERAYAAGKIPGGFFKREGKPSEKETVSARLTDRPIRPLFPKDYRNEIQIVIFVLSADKENDADILGTIGASAALSLSPIPFLGPIASVRVGRIGGEYIINPTFQQLEESDMDVVISGSKESILMVEGWSNQVSEEDMIQALELGHKEIVRIVELQEELIKEAGKPKAPYTPVVPPEELESKLRDQFTDRIAEALKIADKTERKEYLKSLTEEITAAFEEEFPDDVRFIPHLVEEVLKEKMRRQVLETGKRIDGRTLDEIRPIECEVGLLPRAHGSALFTRGQTQSLAATTLGTKMDEQKIEGLDGDSWKRYMLHYNFPPFSVGEIRRMGAPGRREIGHGQLAERALKSLIPSEEDFPYTIRIVSDILESNGSSSMATVCAGSLSLMDAGVPIPTNVAGIAMGLIKEGDEVAILTDILGDEDHMGDMDFKVAGTRAGITALQMDIKIPGITFDIMRTALEKAYDARLYILDIMDATISEPRSSISPYAPRIFTMQIPVETIGMVIGPGGRTIREIIDKTGVTIDIEDDGKVTIAAVDSEAAEEARKIIDGITVMPEVGKTYIGKVKRIMDFGAIVEILPGREGLLHISEIDHKHIRRVEDVLKVGDEVAVKLLAIGDDGKYSLSRKALIPRPPGMEHRHPRRPDRRDRDRDRGGRRDGRGGGHRDHDKRK
ncbi:MAG TPA: polyribonucleotide nucleotidyltransferase [Bacteroidetes bacterium]|nr:polyribonucleotide nucleotidyltransferase [Bacteroidota bacterium]